MELVRLKLPIIGLQGLDLTRGRIFAKIYEEDYEGPHSTYAQTFKISHSTTFTGLAFWCWCRGIYSMNIVRLIGGSPGVVNSMFVGLLGSNESINHLHFYYNFSFCKISMSSGLRNAFYNGENSGRYKI